MDKLSTEQEQELLDALHKQMVSSISFEEGVKIVSLMILDKIQSDLNQLSDEEKVQTYQDLNLKSV